ncbi:Hypothetical protein MVR_LOCUS65 [uncultured virus]|nr:Hypothetical protein MVR_LOCUS65 [uncultured virus]
MIVCVFSSSFIGFTTYIVPWRRVLADNHGSSIRPADTLDARTVLDSTPNLITISPDDLRVVTTGLARLTGIGIVIIEGPFIAPTINSFTRVVGGGVRGPSRTSIEVLTDAWCLTVFEVTLTSPARRPIS